MWDWTDQAHLRAGQDEIEQAMRGNLAGAFEAEATRNATARQEPRRDISGTQIRLVLALLAVIAIGAVVLGLVHG